MLTLLEVVKKSTDFLVARGVESARLNAELLVGQALGLRRMQLYLQFERPLTEAELENIRPLVRRRGNREPLQYILGETEFFNLRLKTDRRALVPRPETEQLVELVVRRLTVPPGRILDLGTGSGAIALALAKHFPSAVVTAVDCSEEALALARENAIALGLESRVRLLRSNWFEVTEAPASFDLIVANPPYLTDEEVATSEPEVRNHEPRQALSAGTDGASALEEIVRGGRSRLSGGGWLALETGINQHARLSALATACNYSQVESLRDYSGRERFFLALA
jgi:release factor glutamine methyltransferase